MDDLQNLFVLDWQPEVWRLVVRIIVAAICGFIIGFERKSRSKEAGIRTHTIVAVAACLMMILSKYAFGDVDGGKFDGARIAAQVVTGIGFLGAGIIYYRRDVMHGLTTAAGIWATAAIGMAVGAGMYVIGVATTIIVLLLQIFLHLPIKLFKSRHLLMLKGQLYVDSAEELAAFMNKLGIVKFTKFKTYTQDGRTVADVEFYSPRNYVAIDLYNLMKENPMIKSIEKDDELQL